MPMAKLAFPGQIAPPTTFCGQILPSDAGLENEEDVGQGRPGIERLTARKPKPPGLGRRKRRFHALPEGLGNQWLGRDTTSRRIGFSNPSLHDQTRWFSFCSNALSDSAAWRQFEVDASNPAAVFHTVCSWLLQVA